VRCMITNQWIESRARS